MYITSSQTPLDRCLQMLSLAEVAETVQVLRREEEKHTGIDGPWQSCLLIVSLMSVLSGLMYVSGPLHVGHIFESESLLHLDIQFVSLVLTSIVISPSITHSAFLMSSSPLLLTLASWPHPEFLIFIYTCRFDATIAPCYEFMTFNSPLISLHSATKSKLHKSPKYSFSLLHLFPLVPSLPQALSPLLEQ